VSTAASSYPRRLPDFAGIARSVATVFADPKTLFGIKLALAGVLSVYLSQLIRLGHASWALFTVLVLAPAQYVGAIGPRSVARVIGTVIGGFIGVWLVGNYQQDRLFFLSFTFGFLWLCMYMYGGTFFPYSFFLLANTLITVSASGIFDPIDAWSVGIARTLEILTGVVSTIIVSHLFWPRFARGEFRDLARSTLGDIGKLIDLRLRSPAAGAKLWEDAQSTVLGIRAQSTRLRTLLQNGANESVHFRQRLADYKKAVVSLTQLFQASLELLRQHKEHPQYVVDARAELSAVYEAIEMELRMLSDTVGSESQIENDRFETTLKALELRIQDLLTSGAARNYSLEDVLDLANHQTALLAIYVEAVRLRGLLAHLPLPGDPPARYRSPRFHWPKISPSRLRDGVKPAIAGTVALLICQWFNPPGAAAIPLTALALTFMNKNFIGGKGDRGALQSAFQVSVGGLIFVILVFWISPALSNYGMMNLFLFTELFAFGYWSAALGGQNIHAGAVMFFIIASVGLDAEKPVAVQTVFGSYFGIVLPIFMAAIVGRLFWPVLPEAELRKRFVDFFSICSNFLTKQPGHGDEMLSERLTFIPIESLSWAKGLKGRHCPGIAVEKIVALTLTMRRLALRLSARAQAESPGLPEGIARLIDPVVEQARENFRMTSDALAQVFREGSTRVPVPSIRTTRQSFRNALQEVRNQNLLVGQNLESVRSYLSLAHRLDVIADDLESCRDQTLSLALERYWGDYSL
jgi:p-hydroxybenzoic acid efflux pump subunit AaeB